MLAIQAIAGRVLASPILQDQATVFRTAVESLKSCPAKRLRINGRRKR